MSRIFFKSIENKFYFEKSIDNYIVKNASIYKRIFAFCIDMFLLLLITVLLISTNLPSNKLSELKGNNEQEQVIKDFLNKEENKIFIKNILSMIFFILFTYFFVLNLYFKSTLGQRVFGLKLISVNNKYITKYEIFNRSLFVSFFIMVINYYILLLFIVILILSKFRITLLDILTGTNIIELKRIK